MAPLALIQIGLLLAIAGMIGYLIIIYQVCRTGDSSVFETDAVSVRHQMHAEARREAYVA